MKTFLIILLLLLSCRSLSYAKTIYEDLAFDTADTTEICIKAFLTDWQMDINNGCINDIAKQIREVTHNDPLTSAVFLYNGMEYVITVSNTLLKQSYPQLQVGGQIILTIKFFKPVRIENEYGDSVPYGLITKLEIEHNANGAPIIANLDTITIEPAPAKIIQSVYMGKAIDDNRLVKSISRRYSNPFFNLISNDNNQLCAPNTNHCARNTAQDSISIGLYSPAEIDGLLKPINNFISLSAEKYSCDLQDKIFNVNIDKPDSLHVHITVWLTNSAQVLHNDEVDITAVGYYDINDYRYILYQRNDVEFLPLPHNNFGCRMFPLIDVTNKTEALNDMYTRYVWRFAYQLPVAYSPSESK